MTEKHGQKDMTKERKESSEAEAQRVERKAKNKGDAPLDKQKSKNEPKNKAAGDKASENKIIKGQQEEEALTLDDMINAIKVLSEENEKLKNQLLRLAADKENMNKRHRNDLEEASKFSTAKMSKDFVEVLENMYRATSAIKEEELEASAALKNLHEGIVMTQKSFLSTLERNGVTRILPKGEAFNHDLHQAVSQAEGGGHKPGMVVEVLQAGYLLNGRLLNPAMVVVAK